MIVFVFLFVFLFYGFVLTQPQAVINTSNHSLLCTRSSPGSLWHLLTCCYFSITLMCCSTSSWLRVLSVLQAWSRPLPSLHTEAFSHTPVISNDFFCRWLTNVYHQRRPFLWPLFPSGACNLTWESQIHLSFSIFKKPTHYFHPTDPSAQPGYCSMTWWTVKP